MIEISKKVFNFTVLATKRLREIDCFLSVHAFSVLHLQEELLDVSSTHSTKQLILERYSQYALCVDRCHNFNGLSKVRQG